MRVLVAYGSKMGSTASIAELVGEALTDAGLDVDVRMAAEVPTVAPYRAVIVGGALYAGRWHRDARRFIRRFGEELRERPTWLFSSGPLDDSASVHDLPPVPFVASLMRRIGARGHRTFGGALLVDAATGVVTRVMAKDHGGDWRDPVAIEGWAAAIATELRSAPVGGGGAQ